MPCLQREEDLGALDVAVEKGNDYYLSSPKQFYVMSPYVNLKDGMPTGYALLTFLFKEHRDAFFHLVRNGTPVGKDNLEACYISASIKNEGNTTGRSKSISVWTPTRPALRSLSGGDVVSQTVTKPSITYETLLINYVGELDRYQIDKESSLNENNRNKLKDTIRRFREQLIEYRVRGKINVSSSSSCRTYRDEAGVAVGPAGRGCPCQPFAPNVHGMVQS